MRNLWLLLVCCSFVCGIHAIKKLAEMSDYSDHPCIRSCGDNSLPRRCEYDWTLELYYTLSKACFDCPFNLTDCTRPHCVTAEGTSRGILTANRVLPGPEIQVCEGDEIVVNVHNAMDTVAGTTIHWHGLLQRGTPHMDGVNLITQCSIHQLSTFQYRFMAKDPGTYWWHSHAGLQRSEGLFGHLVIRQNPSRDPHSALYDYDLPEHVMSITDWLIQMTDNRFAAHHHDDGDNKPAAMLINGKGAFHEFMDPTTGNKTHTPHAEFTVKPGNRYRFRVISAAQLNCPIQVSVDNHTLMVIASDGSNFDPIVVDSFNIFAGERYDFVLITHNFSQPINHWIRVRGLADCSNKKAHQVAVLRYEGAPPGLPGLDTSYEAGERLGIKLNPWNTRGTDMLIPVDRLNSTEPDDDSLQEVPDRRFYLAMDFNKIDNFHFNKPGLYPLASVASNKHLYSPQINHLSFSLPRVPPLTQFEDINEEETFCNPEQVQVHCDQEYCECTHRLKVALGEVVELIFIDEGVIFNANHPMHLHGYKFRVIGMDRLNESTSIETIKAMDRNGQLRRKFTKGILKDTVTVPDGGYTIIRFKADNPGIWLMHCHIEFHAAIGMGLIIQVGEASQFPKRPRNFPTCGNWRYTSDDDDSDKESTDVNDKSSQCSANSSSAVESCRSLVLMLVVVLAVCEQFLRL
ncbi:uncharacterized protein [Littorina saxatilis]|uniref:uncharacterized protein n=1 Tax=Littorina saxatilis TaxID=31220 RepID=UPI0038B51996